MKALQRVAHLDLVLLIHAWPGLGVDGSEQLVPQHVHVVRDGQSKGKGQLEGIQLCSVGILFI